SRMTMSVSHSRFPSKPSRTFQRRTDRPSTIGSGDISRSWIRIRSPRLQLLLPRSAAITSGAKLIASVLNSPTTKPALIKNIGNPPFLVLYYLDVRTVQLHTMFRDFRRGRPTIL